MPRNRGGKPVTQSYLDYINARRRVWDVITQKIKIGTFYVTMGSLLLSIILLAIFKPLAFLPADSLLRGIGYLLLGLIPSGVSLGTSIFLLKKKYAIGKISPNLETDAFVRFLRTRDKNFDHAFVDMINKNREDAANAAKPIEQKTVYSSVSGSAKIGATVDFSKSGRHGR